MGVSKKINRYYREVKRLAKIAIKPFVDYLISPGFRLRAKYAKYLKLDIAEQTILYESYHGKNMTGNVYALYKKLSKDPEFSHYEHVWAVDSLDNPCIDSFIDKEKIKVVKIHSLQYAKYLATAKYLINDTSFPYYFQKRDGQVYINTWHGTPLKTLGKDVKGTSISAHSNITRNLLHTDYLLMPNKFTAERLIQSHDIDGLYNGYIVDSGYPRVDLTLNSDVKEMKKRFNINTDKKIILYAPTWRGSSEKDSTGEVEKIFEDVQHLKSIFSDDYEVLLKVHYFVYKNIAKMGMGDICIPNWVDTNELLSCVDILITDYSSIFFDFLPTKKPVIFYMFDRESYEKDRGFYISLDSLPGPICKNIDDLVQTISNLSAIQEKYSEQYKNFLETYCYHDDGKATDRAFELIFKGKSSELKYKIINDKKKILFYCGGFYNNGITMSAINLSKYIDYDKYDVVIIEPARKKDEQINNIQKLDPRTKIIYRIGTWNMTIRDYYRYNLVYRKGLYSDFIKKIVPRELFAGELQRMFGNTKFDYVVDFGGYNKFWSTMFAFSDIKWKSIYLHNDMMEEFYKKINGKWKHKTNLKVIFSTYQYYDRIVSVAKSTRDTNYKNLKHLVPEAEKKMVYVNNVIDYKRILEESEPKDIIELFGNKYHLTDISPDHSELSIKGFIWPDDSDIVFVNVGRLSPEKGQEKLIKAFYSVKNKTNKNLKLYIVGSGPLQKQLKNLVENLSLEEDVIFTGQLENPFPIINRADCYVMSSNYEGQGLAILEALVLEKYVVATDVTGIRSVLEDGYGELVDNDQESLEQGMLNFLNNPKHFKKFDYVKYNEEALSLFYQEVCNE